MNQNILITFIHILTQKAILNLYIQISRTNINNIFLQSEINQ